MKSTGMTRRIDELGRVVIPKEIRRSLRLNVGEELEIFVNDETLMMKRYSVLSARRKLARKTADILRKTLNASAIITDLDLVLATSCVNLCDYEGRKISDELLKVLEKRETLLMQNCSLPVCNGDDSKVSALLISPLFTGGDLFGGIVLFKENGCFEQKDVDLLKITAEIVATDFSF